MQNGAALLVRCIRYNGLIVLIQNGDLQGAPILQIRISLNQSVVLDIYDQHPERGRIVDVANQAYKRDDIAIGGVRRPSSIIQPQNIFSFIAHHLVIPGGILDIHLHVRWQFLSCDGEAMPRMVINVHGVDDRNRLHKIVQIGADLRLGLQIRVYISLPEQVLQIAIREDHF
ncbi:hypothetical protein D3C81_979410 [compost metagenome]